MTPIATRKRMSSGEPTLDQMMGGGFIEGTATLISGAPGVGKTTLGLQFLQAGIKAGEPGILVTFEEFPASLIRDTKGLGWDLEKLQAEGMLQIIFTSPGVFLNSLQQPDSPLAEALRNISPRRAVIDSAAPNQTLHRRPRQTARSLQHPHQRPQTGGHHHRYAG